MSLSVQFLSLLAMIGTGIIAAAVIDAIGTGIDYSGKKSLFRRYDTLIEIVAWLIVGALSFLVLYLVRDGAWRIYDPLAQFSGLLLYISFVHRPLRFIGRLILLLLVKPIWFVFSSLLLVIKHGVYFIWRLILVVFSPFVSIFRKLSDKYFKKKVK